MSVTPSVEVLSNVFAGMVPAGIARGSVYVFVKSAKSIPKARNLTDKTIMSFKVEPPVKMGRRIFRLRPLGLAELPHLTQSVRPGRRPTE